MANLPTAYASQRFGRKTLDFYAVEGEVAGADPRARAEERRLQDIDGARHTVRLMESGFELEPGQAATVLRMQPGPARRSRPVAVVNHDTGAWCRTHPGAEGLLAKAGVSRTFNWVLTMGLFAVAALAMVWSFLRAFLVEVDPSLFGRTPDLNLAELAAGALPALTDWTFADAVAPITGPLADAAPALAPVAEALVFGAGVLIAALGVYLLRSWRLLWAPLFVGALGAAALGYGGVAGVTGPALAGLGLAALLFLLGGLINRIRDSARLEARIAVLADHLLRQGPQDAVAPAEAGAEEAEVSEPVEALAPAVATAASLREPGEIDADVADEEADAEIAAEPGDPEAADAESAEAADQPVDAGAQTEDAPASETEAEALAADDAGVDEHADAAAAKEAEDTVADAVEAEPESAEDAAPEPSDAEPEAAEAGDGAAETAAEADEAVQDAAEPAEPQAANQSEAAPVEGPEPQQADALETETKAPDPAADAETRDTDLSADTTPAGLDADEAERLRNDPRYASRAIVLPPPPPMPDPSAGLGEGSGEAVGPRETQTLKPNAPLPDNVIPIFAAPASSEITASAVDAETPDGDTPKDG